MEANVQVSWKDQVRSSAMRWSGFIKAPETGRYTLRYKADGGYRIWVNDQLIIDAWKLDWRAVIASGSIDLAAGQIYSLKVESFQRGEQGNEQLIWSLPSDPGAEGRTRCRQSIRRCHLRRRPHRSGGRRRNARAHARFLSAATAPTSTYPQANGRYCKNSTPPANL